MEPVITQLYSDTSQQLANIRKNPFKINIFFFSCLLCFAMLAAVWFGLIGMRQSPTTNIFEAADQIPSLSFDNLRRRPSLGEHLSTAGSDMAQAIFSKVSSLSKAQTLSKLVPQKFAEKPESSLEEVTNKNPTVSQDPIDIRLKRILARLDAILEE